MTAAAVARPRENVAVTFLALLLLTGLVAALALGPLTSQGLIPSLSLLATIGWAGAAIAVVAGVWAILIRWRGRSAASVGFTREALRPLPLVVGFGLGSAAVLVAVALGAIGGLRLGSGPEVSHPAAWRFAVGVLAFFLSSIMQDVLLVSGLMVGLDPRLPRAASIGIPAVIFAGLHLGMPNGTVIAPLTDASFAVVLACFFFWGGEQRSLAMPVGIHTAWNAGIAIVLGLPLTGQDSTWAFVRHQGGDQLWAGGTYGPEGGVSGFIAVLLLLALGLILRSRRAGQDV